MHEACTVLPTGRYQITDKWDSYNLDIINTDPLKLEHICTVLVTTVANPEPLLGFVNNLLASHSSS